MQMSFFHIKLLKETQQNLNSADIKYINMQILVTSDFQKLVAS